MRASFMLLCLLRMGLYAQAGGVFGYMVCTAQYTSFPGGVYWMSLLVFSENIKKEEKKIPSPDLLLSRPYNLQNFLAHDTLSIPPCDCDWSMIPSGM